VKGKKDQAPEDRSRSNTGKVVHILDLAEKWQRPPRCCTKLIVTGRYTAVGWMASFSQSGGHIWKHKAHCWSLWGFVTQCCELRICFL